MPSEPSAPRSRAGRLGPVAVAIVIAAAATAGCASPSRRLTPRVVEDPIVLPRRLIRVGIGVGHNRYWPNHERANWDDVGIRYGITDRLEWDDLFSLRYALLDDRPADGRPPRPLSLAVRAGFLGMAFSSTEGLIMQPVVAVQTLKHVGDRWALFASVEWLAIWMARPAAIPAYDSTLGYPSRRRAFWYADVGATRQLGERFALTLGTWLGQTDACISPTCDWFSRSAGTWLHLSFRPWHWLTVGAGPRAGLRWRPGVITVTNPADPAPTPPERVEWLGAAASVSFYW